MKIIFLLKKATDNAYSFAVIAKVFSIITGLIYSILYSRYLGADLRGTAAVISNYAELMMLVSCLGIYQAYPYFKKITGVTKYKEYINYIFGLFFLYCFFSITYIVLIKPSIDVCIILALIPLMMIVKQLNYVVLIENPKLRNLAQIFLDIFDILLLIILIIFTKVNYSYMIVLLLSKQFIAFLIAYKNLKVHICDIKPTLKGIMPYIRYGIIPMFTVLLMEINYKVDVLMLDHGHISNADIGVYTLGVMLAQRLWIIPDALKDILLSKLVHGKNEDEVCKITRLSFWITFIFVMGMVLLGRPLIRLMFGQEYIEAYTIIIIIVFGVLGMVFYKMIYSYNVANGKKYVNFIILGLAALANITLNYITIPKMGIMGAAVSSMISYTACGLAFWFYFCKKTGKSMLDLILINRKDISLMISYLKK